MASKIYVEKINETYIKVFSDAGVLKELSDKFTFFVEGYRHMPKYRSGIWDGKIRLFNQITGQLYAGLFRQVYDFAKESGYQIEYVENDKFSRPFNKQVITTEVLDSFIKDLRIQSNGEDLDQRDYQSEAIKKALENYRISLVSPTASGKSYIIYAILRWFLEEDKKCLLIVPTTSLVEQMYSDFEDYSTANEFDVEENVQVLYSGKTKVFSKNILITTWQSVQNEKTEFFSEYEVVVGDEAHGFKANKLKGIMEKLSNAKVRIATTGTMPKSEADILTITGLFGSIYNVISTKELMDLGYVSNIQIACLLLNYPREVLKEVGASKFNYKQELDYIVTNQKRNERIIKLANSVKGNTIVLFNFVEAQGIPLYELAKEISDKKVYIIHGGIKIEERERIRKEAATIDNGLYIVSYGTFSTGVNMPSIKNGIIGSPVKSSIRLLQSIGRGLRLDGYENMFYLYDIGDNLKLSNKSKNNITLNHYISRLEIYEEQQFKYKIIEVNY